MWQESIDMMVSESAYQRSLIKRLEMRFPGCFIMLTDPSRTQGLPDILILFGPYWAMLEVKLSESAPIRPNQVYYVEKFNELSFAAFIYPENEEAVLYALQHAFGIKG